MSSKPRPNFLVPISSCWPRCLALARARALRFTRRFQSFHAARSLQRARVSFFGRSGDRLSAPHAFPSWRRARALARFRVERSRSSRGAIREALATTTSASIRSSTRREALYVKWYGDALPSRRHCPDDVALSHRRHRSSPRVRVLYLTRPQSPPRSLRRSLPILGLVTPNRTPVSLSSTANAIVADGEAVMFDETSSLGENKKNPRLILFCYIGAFDHR